MKRMNFPGRKEARQKAAAERQKAYDALSDDEKIAKVRERCGHSRSDEETKIRGKKEKTA